MFLLHNTICVENLVIKLSRYTYITFLIILKEATQTFTLTHIYLNFNIQVYMLLLHAHGLACNIMKMKYLYLGLRQNDTYLYHNKRERLIIKE